MTTTATSTAASRLTAGNSVRGAQVERAWRETLAAAQVRGFFGTVAVEVTLQDGTIQNIRRRVEQIEK